MTKDDQNQVLVAAIASGVSQKRAAELAGMSERTASRRMAEPAVRDALAVERTRLASEIADALQGSMRAGTGRMWQIIANGNDRDAAAAWRAVSAEARAWREAAWVADRLDALEVAMKAQQAEMWGE